MHILTKYIATGLTALTLTAGQTPRYSWIQQEMDKQLVIYKEVVKQKKIIEEEAKRLEEEQRILEEQKKREEEEQKEWMDWELTFYCPCSYCSGEWGVQTASGQPLVPYITCAADGSIPFGTKIHIEGWGELTVVDRGGAVSNNVLDVFVSDHNEALKLGRKFLKGYIIE